MKRVWTAVVTALVALWTGLPGDVLAQEPEAGATTTQTVPGTDVSFDVAYVTGGSFTLGSPADQPGRDDDEGPQVEVSVEPFWMGVTEVTHDLFSIFRDRRLDSPVGADDTPFDADAVTRPSPPYEDPSAGMAGPGYPATGMTRLSALRFARWLSEKTGRLYRLPTEAEWEFACRAGTTGVFGFGDDPSAAGDHAWYEENSGDALQPVGAKTPNAWGLHDMHGNAAEWTLDPYVADFYGRISPDVDAPIGSDAETRYPAVNPTTGPSTRGRGVVRGGAFDDDSAGLRCADRLEETPAWKRRDPQIPKSRWWNTDSPHVGFRLVSPAAEHTMDEINAYWERVLGSN